MRRLAFISLFILLAYSASSQATIPAWGLSNAQFYEINSKPTLRTIGPLSDSLAALHDISDFLIHDNTYYGVETWADYFLWFVNKYEHQFGAGDRLLYEFHYSSKNDVQMSEVLANNFFFQERFKDDVTIQFTETSVRQIQPDFAFGRKYIY
ncbi:hypothetical protein [Ekhidna sp. To15]|uniref:hypothetical protein n=1 Tax=Ekhidna sp. To15 TaxID=3395267 RepID=UPI003F523565